MVALYTAPDAGAAEGADRLRRSPFSRPLGRARSTAHMGRPASGKGRTWARHSAVPHCGKKFSIAWKTAKNIFHSVEKSSKNLPYCGKIGLFFPYRGKIFSIAWKARASRTDYPAAARQVPPRDKGQAWPAAQSRKSFPYCGKLRGRYTCKTYLRDESQALNLTMSGLDLLFNHLHGLVARGDRNAHAHVLAFDIALVQTVQV